MNKLKFTLSQTETLGNIQDRLFVELLRIKSIFEEKHDFKVVLKILGQKEIIRKNFTAEETEQISKALSYIDENEKTFPTKGSPVIKLERKNKLLLRIKYTNGWNFMLKLGETIFKIQYNELKELNAILQNALEIIKVQSK